MIPVEIAPSCPRKAFIDSCALARPRPDAHHTRSPLRALRPFKVATCRAFSESAPGHQAWACPLTRVMLAMRQAHWVVRKEVSSQHGAGARGDHGRWVDSRYKLALVCLTVVHTPRLRATLQRCCSHA